MSPSMEELIADSLRIFDDSGEVGLEAFLAEHLEHRQEIESGLEELRAAGFLGAAPAQAVSESPPPPVLGEFELGERLGGGGMGEVYRAWQPSLRRHVALKVLRPDRAHVESARQRFRAEAEAVAQLRHPAIVPVFEFGEAGDQLWLAMELVDGRTLGDVISALSARRPSHLRGEILAELVGAGADPRIALFVGPWTEVCSRIAIRIADALECAHAAGIVHRDVKPSNVFVTRDGHVQLFDFGLARSMGAEARLTRTGDTVGSPVYMAPEQVRGEPPDARTDVYALGVTLYELLALELPFVGTEQWSLRSKILHGEVVPLRRRNPAVSWEIDTIVACAMDPDPKRRYASIAALRDDLRRVLAHESIRARRAGAWRRAARFCQRRPAVAVGVTAIFLLGVGVPTAIGVEQAAGRRAVEAERTRAERNLVTAVDAVEKFLAAFGGDELAYLPQLDAIALYIDLLEARPDDVRLRIALAEARRRRIWQLKRVGELGAADALLDQALRDLPGRDSVVARMVHSHLLRQRASIARERDDLGAAEAALDEALALVRVGADVDERVEHAVLRIERARVLNDTGRCLASVEEFQGGLAELRAGVSTTVFDVPFWTAHALRCLATAQIRVGRRPEALAALRDALAILEPRLAGPTVNTGTRMMAAEVLGRIASVLAETSEREPARASYDRAIGLSRGLVAQFPDLPGYRNELVELLVSRALLSDAELRAQLFAEAERECDPGNVALGLRIARFRLDEANAADRDALAAALAERLDALEADTIASMGARARMNVANALHSLAVARYEVDPEEAEQIVLRAAELKRGVAAELRDDLEIEESLANTRAMLATVRSSMGLNREALAELLEVIRLRERLLDLQPAADWLRHRLSGTCFNAACAALDLEDSDQAVELARRGEAYSAAAVAAADRSSWRRRLYAVRCLLADTLVRAGRAADVESVADAIAATYDNSTAAIIAARKLASALPGADDPDLLERLSARTVALIAVAGARGFTAWVDLERQPEFQILRPRADFRRVVDSATGR